MLIGAAALKEITKPMNRVLHGIERGMIHSQYVDIKIIQKYSGLNEQKTEYWLQKAHKLDLIRRWTGHFVGYELTINGYDALALNALYEKGKIRSIGMEKGTGKESVVYYVLDAQDRENLLKFHRVGYTSFQHVRKKRRYTSTKNHMSPLYASRLSAEAEYKWLKKAAEHNLPVPKTFAQNRHIIMMEDIKGYDLNLVNTIDDPEFVYEQVLDFIKQSWDAGFIHGDLSEFNIIINDEAEITVIDFPQAEKTNHPNADELLERDILNTTNYFKRKFKIHSDEKEIKKRIMGGKEMDY